MAPASAPSPTKPIPNDSVSQLLELSVPGLNFLQRFTAACWQMTDTWLETEGGERGSDPLPTLPLERVVIGQRFYSAGVKYYLAQDWNSATENLGSSLHLQLYPYVQNGAAMRAWHRHVASNDLDAVAMRMWIGRLLIIYGKTQLAWAKHINDIHAADVCYLSANAAVGLLHSLKGNTPERPFTEEGIRILFPGEALEVIGNVDDALALRNECAHTLVDIAFQGDSTSMFYALLPLGVTFNPIRNAVDLLHQLQRVLHTPIRVDSNLHGGPNRSINRGGCDNFENHDDSEDSQDDVTLSISLDVDEARMKKEEKQLMKMKPLKALHTAAIVAAHINRDWYSKEVGIDCWNEVSNAHDVRKCRDAVEALWSAPWKKDEAEIDPSPSSLMSAMHLVQLATWQANQVLQASAVGMRHPIGQIILSNDGFRWSFMEYFYQEKLQSGNGVDLIRRLFHEALPSRPSTGTAPNSLIPCIDYSRLQNSLLQLDEGALRDLLAALKGLERAQFSVGGPEAFWPLIQLDNGGIITYDGGAGGIAGRRPANETLSESEFHLVIAAIIEATKHQHPLHKSNTAGQLSGSSASSTVGGKTVKGILEEPWNHGAQSLFGEGLGIPPPKHQSLHRRGVKALTGLILISFDDAVVIVALLVCFICALSLYRALFHPFGWGSKLKRALTRHGSGRGGSSRSIASHSAWVITQRNAAATSLREAIASESIPHLTSAVKQAEEAGVEKPLVKKGKDRLSNLKRRKVGLSHVVASNTGSAPNSRPLSRSNTGGSRNDSNVSTSAAATAVAAMRLLTKGQHTPANSGDQATSQWANEDEWVVVSPKTHGIHQQQHQNATNFATGSSSSSSPNTAAAVSPTVSGASEKKEASTPSTPVRQPLPPSSQFGVSEEGQQPRAAEKQQQAPQQPSTPTASSPLQTTPSKFTAASPAAENLGSARVADSLPVARKVAAAVPAARMQHKVGSHNQLSSSPSSISSISTSTTELETTFSPELRQTRSLPPSRLAVTRPSGSGGNSVAAVSQPVVARSVSAPSHGVGNLQGVTLEKPEAVQGKSAPKIVLVKRSSLQQRPSPDKQAGGNKKTLQPGSKESPTNTKAAISFSAGASTSAAAQQLPVLSFGAPPVKKSSKINPLAASFEPSSMYGNTSLAKRSSLAAAVVAENEARQQRETASFLLAQAQASWSPSSAPSAEAAAAAYARAKAAAASGYDEIGYSDAWASIGQHFSSNLSPSTGAAQPLSPSFAPAGGFTALSPSGPFDARVPSVVSTETSLGLSLLPTDSSLSAGLSGRTSSLHSGTGELLASLQQIWEGPPSADGSLTPPHSSQTTTPLITTPLSAATAGGVHLASSSHFGELLPSAGLTRLTSPASPSEEQQQASQQWLGNEDEVYIHRSTSNFTSSSLSFRGYRAHSGSLADLGFEESSEF